MFVARYVSNVVANVFLVNQLMYSSPKFPLPNCCKLTTASTSHHGFRRYIPSHWNEYAIRISTIISPVIVTGNHLPLKKMSWEWQQSSAITVMGNHTTWNFQYVWLFDGQFLSLMYPPLTIHIHSPSTTIIKAVSSGNMNHAPSFTIIDSNHHYISKQQAACTSPWCST